MNAVTLRRALAGEAVGSMLLAACVIGSGVMAQKLSGGNEALALLGNTLATCGILVAMILTFAPISGAHFNPLVSLIMRMRGELSTPLFLAYVSAQTVGMGAGVVLAHAMFELPIFQIATKVRSGPAQCLSEVVASFVLLLTILRVSKANAQAVPYAVAAAILAGYWFTASTSFANPAITLARSFTDTFAGIAPADVLAFVAAQVAGGSIAFVFDRWLSSTE